MSVFGRVNDYINMSHDMTKPTVTVRPAKTRISLGILVAGRKLILVVLSGHGSYYSVYKAISSKENGLPLAYCFDRI